MYRKQALACQSLYGRESKQHQKARPQHVHGTARWENSSDEQMQLLSILAPIQSMTSANEKRTLMLATKSPPTPLNADTEACALLP